MLRKILLNGLTNSKKLEVVFTKSKKKLPIFSWLIRLWTNKQYSHVAVKFNTTRFFGTDTYCQASDGLVNYMSEVQFDKKHTIVDTRVLEVSDKMYMIIRV